MPTEDDLKPKADDEDAPRAAADEERSSSDASDASGRGRALGMPNEPGGSLEVSAEVPPPEATPDEAEGFAPTQLGTQRFVYAAYFAGGIAVAFLLSKAMSYAWLRLSTYKPAVGEPHDEIVMPIAGLIGLFVAIYYYRDQKTRTLAEEVAFELGKVTWPSREEVVNGTFVVVITTLLATTFFALMDRFWGFVTNLVYGA
jgi:preprotein translocase subunit SecE